MMNAMEDEINREAADAGGGGELSALNLPGVEVIESGHYEWELLLASQQVFGAH
jgi:hypothetical protein